MSKACRKINIPLPVLLFALTLAFYGACILYTGFNGLYGQDPYGYYDYARALFAGTALAGLPQADYWPAGYPFIIAAGFKVLGVQPLAAQIPSAVAGAVVVALMTLVTHDLVVLEHRTAEQAVIAGLVAGLVALSGGQLTQWSVSAMADTPALMWATLSVWALLRWFAIATNTSIAPRWGVGRADNGGPYGLNGPARRCRAQRIWLVVAGVTLAAAISTRWMYVVLLPVFSLLLLIADLQRATPSASGGVSSLYRSGRLVLGFVCIVLIGVSPQLWLSGIADGELARSHWIREWSLIHAFSRTFSSTDGQATYPLPVGLFYLRAFGSPRMLSPLFWPFLALGLWAIWRWRMLRAAMVVCAWGGLMYGFLAGLPYQNMRYTLAQIPIVASVAGIGAAWVWGMLPQLRLALALVCLIGLLSGGWYGLGMVQELSTRQRTDLATAQWVEQALPGHARVLAFELTLTLRHATNLDVHELYGLPIAQLKCEVALKRPLFLIVELHKLQSQWAGTPLEDSYLWLHDGPGLVELGRLNGYVLYRVQ